MVNPGRGGKDYSLRFLVPKRSTETRTISVVGITKAWREAIWISGEGGLMLSAGRKLSHNKS